MGRFSNSDITMIKHSLHWEKIGYGYSGVPNKRVGWNISQKLINMLFLINVLVGNFGMLINAN